MPIFEYRCKNCEKEFEALVLGRENPRCPTCDGGKLEKLLSSFAAITGVEPGVPRRGGRSLRLLRGPARSGRLLDELASRLELAERA